LAQQQRDELANAEKVIQFYVAPMVADGAPFYRVLAGPLPDSASATAVRDSLLAKRIKTISSSADIVATPYAFLLQEFLNRGEAEARQQEAEKSGVPSYIVAATDSTGTTSYKLYAGAFTGRGEADFMRPLLKSAGFPDNLVERTGSSHS
jgi:cell division septation protein DedD